ncbi:Uncharacterized protein SCF082_LOCUS34716, partial [Durusdinium trenchii]
MVMDAFKDPERSKLSVEKMFNFLTEAMTIHGKKLVHAPMPVTDEMLMNMTERLRNAEYDVCITSLASDYKEAVNFNLKRTKALGAFQRRVMSDAAQKFEGADISKLHNLGFVDVTKFGRLSAVEIDEVAKWTKRVLQINDDYSMVLVICPILPGTGVLGGLRGEHRRVEDKMISMGIEMKNVQITLDLKVALDVMLELQESAYLDWKNARGHMANTTPKFGAEPDVTEITTPTRPTLKLRAMSADGHLQIPEAVRKKTLTPSLSRPLLELLPPPNPPRGSEEVDLGKPAVENATATEVEDVPPKMTAEEFKQKFPEIKISVTLNMGQNVVLHCVEGGQLFLTTAAKFRLVGVDANNPKPLLCYAGGTWISDNAK